MKATNASLLEQLNSANNQNKAKANLEQQDEEAINFDQVPSRGGKVDGDDKVLDAQGREVKGTAARILRVMRAKNKK